ncbi:hypothetical protein [Actinocorallia populi]|uniref:hypothetical protein n=1 Tax=Actinocorallia populi TaxID=2079200 RepID=UPI000D093F61|nr:hypothetical protein [Actinocorallia populi]
MGADGEAERWLELLEAAGDENGDDLVAVRAGTQGGGLEGFHARLGFHLLEEEVPLDLDEYLGQSFGAFAEVGVRSSSAATTDEADACG